jgi:hypothetical protein
MDEHDLAVISTGTGNFLPNRACILEHHKVGKISDNDGYYGYVLARLDYPGKVEYVVWTMRYSDLSCTSGYYYDKLSSAALEFDKRCGNVEYEDA